MHTKIAIALVISLLVLLVLGGCSPVSSALRGAADTVDGIDTRPPDDPSRSDPLSNLAYAGGSLAVLLFGTFIGGKYITAKRDRLNGTG